MFREQMDRRRDTFDAVNDAARGKDIAEVIKKRLTAFEVVLPPDAKYLAIGAGQAQAEMEFARALGVAEPRITLLDKKFSSKAVTRFTDTAFSGQQIEEDIFRFLDTPAHDKFDVVSAIGMEYVFDTQEGIEKLAAGLSTRMNPEGVALLLPSSFSGDATSTWNNYGFTSLGPNSNGTPRYYTMLFRTPVVKGLE